MPIAALLAATLAVPAISPTPQTLTPRTDRITITRTVHIVADEGADPAAVEVVERALLEAGAQRVTHTAGPGLTVYLGVREALDALHLAGPEGLAAGGYVLGAGRHRIALAGVDPAGTFYAAQSLRQALPRRTRPGASVRGFAIRDWPATPIRGVIEGFYGIPWTHAARLDQMDFYGEHKMNIYVYSPKDDPFLRERWREPYPADQLAQIAELVDRARANHVEFTYALSPGLSVCYSSDADVQALIEKFQTVWDIGVRTFAIPLDDISYTRWNCAADEARFGTGGAAAGAAQSHLLNRVNREFIATHPGAQALQMVPTEYYDVNPSPYKSALADQLDDDVLVEWTGVGVIAPTMTVDQARAAKSVFGHEILTWDNYPVNDYVTNRLLLGPFNGREPGLAEELAGITANPMNQPAASKLALFTVADYTWNDRAYEARTSYAAALREMAGGEGAVERALRAFADVNYSSLLNAREAPELSPLIEELWDGEGTAKLSRALHALRDAPALLRDRLPDRGFVDDAKPWLDSAEAWGTATLTALRLADAVRRDDAPAAWRLRQELPALVATAKSFTYTNLNGQKIPVLVGEGVLEPFVERAQAEHDTALGVVGPPKGLTSLGTYQSNSIGRMVDGDDATHYWSNRSVAVGDWVGVDLGSEQPLTSVALAMGKPTSPNDYIHHGVLESSSDGSSWRQVATFDETADVSASAPAGTRARYVRARATQAQTFWLVVRELRVEGPARPVVSGGPEGDLRNAADGLPDTTYTAARDPRPGEALEIALGEVRRASTVVVLSPSGAEARADVQVRSGGIWQDIGRLGGAYTALDAGGRDVDAVRLAWKDGSGAPAISEVIVR